MLIQGTRVFRAGAGVPWETEPVGFDPDAVVKVEPRRCHGIEDPVCRLTFEDESTWDVMGRVEDFVTMCSIEEA